MSKSESRHRTVVRAVRLTPDEAAAVDAAAAARGIGPSTMARNAILRAARLPVPKSAQRVSVEAAAVVPLLTALSRIGTNINQVAVRANAIGLVDMKAVETAAHHLAAVHREIRRLGGDHT